MSGDVESPMEQLEIVEELEAAEGFDEWLDSLPCPPWADDEAA
jgi:hypothetical protein